MADSNAAQGVEEFVSRVAQRNPHQPEFLQAVQELVEAVFPLVQDRQVYRDERILERLTEPDRLISFRVAWEDDDGTVHIDRGYRVQFNSALGPYKGGLRFSPTVDESVLKFLGFEQTFKNALTGLPMGGGKGGSDFDPKGRSDREVLRFCRAFMTELHRHIDEDTDVPAGDIGVGAREIGYLYGQYRRLLNRSVGGVLTGKAPGYGGSLLRKEATGYGCVYFAQEMLAHVGDDVAGKTCVVSGSGNVAIYTAEKLLQCGAQVVALSDSAGTVHDRDGLTPEKLEWVRDLKEVRRGRIAEYAEHFGAAYRAGERPWSVPADAAFPCATQNELDDAGAEALLAGGCRLVVEGANMPTVPNAVARLQHAGVLFAPAKAANAGGVAVSGLELTQNQQRLSWPAEQVDDKLQQIMGDIHAQCLRWGAREGAQQGGERVDYVRGANRAGFVRVADAMVAQGIS